ncbi:uncharacterized protein EV422DRAFT_545931 [Fimicolochytrium jonesii]|uniref:uncharacterized protein n=1 Tax=Fimicolochytrium jonesii TaxID=1396493 RepID=UPI0022FED2F2|nr:uncharacterized protein EV422DRAFT_545931 [Fimicolochytrium jonesii]KAI8816417.1 hypothetical protein EV422DRAFT_545931 [Fimicolochytrium jonesii]
MDSLSALTTSLLTTSPPTPKPRSSVLDDSMSRGGRSRPSGTLKGHIHFALGTFALIKGREDDALDHFLRAGEEGVASGTAVSGFFSEFRMGLGGATDEDGERLRPTKENYETAESLYTMAALRGSGLAMARLAFLKTHGRVGIKINHAEADKWRRACAGDGKTVGLGGGKGSDALQWLQFVADAGVPTAEFCLALCYFNGIATDEDNSKAFYWCEKAAQHGVAGAQNVLGNLYVEGQGCETNPTIGLGWYIKAAAQREAAAIYNIGTLFERGIAVEEDTAQAFAWYERAARFGSINAMNTLGIFYEQGIGLDHYMPFHAVRCYIDAARMGHPHAQYNLGRCYHEGFGIVRDDSKASLWFTQSAHQHHGLSQLSLGICHELALGVPQNATLAMHNYRLAVQNGCEEVAVRLAPHAACHLLPRARLLLTPPRTPTHVARIHALPVELIEHILTFVPSTPLPQPHLRALFNIAATPASLFSHHMRTKTTFLELLGLAHLSIGNLTLDTCDCTRFDDSVTPTERNAAAAATATTQQTPQHCRAIKHVVQAIEDAQIRPPRSIDWNHHRHHMNHAAPAAEASTHPYATREEMETGYETPSQRTPTPRDLDIAEAWWKVGTGLERPVSEMGDDGASSASSAASLGGW